MKHLWRLDPSIIYLNHGSFGACPSEVLDAQSALRDEMERAPMDFLVRELPDRLDRARASLANFIGAADRSLVFVRNATEGIGAVLRSLPLAAGDELLTTNHAYHACANALRFVAERAGAHVRVADVPFPLQDPGEVVDAVLQCVGPRTRLCLIDHVTSQTGLVFPIQALVDGLRARGVRSLVDGAHAPGMVPLTLDALAPDYYAANLHKWVCAPKGAGFLYVADKHINEVRPLAISHGADRRRPGRSRFHDEFDWTGTSDVTPYLCVEAALAFMHRLHEGGFEGVMRENRLLALAGRRLLASSLEVEIPAPDEMIGSLASVPLPDDVAPPPDPMSMSQLQTSLRDTYAIEVPVFPWPRHPQRVVRISAQRYTSADDVRQLAEALRALL